MSFRTTVSKTLITTSEGTRRALMFCDEDDNLIIQVNGAQLEIPLDVLKDVMPP